MNHIADGKVCLVGYAGEVGISEKASVIPIACKASFKLNSESNSNLGIARWTSPEDILAINVIYQLGSQRAFEIVKVPSSGIMITIDIS